MKPDDILNIDDPAADLTMLKAFMVQAIIALAQGTPDPTGPWPSAPVRQTAHRSLAADRGKAFRTVRCFRSTVFAPTGAGRRPAPTNMATPSAARSRARRAKSQTRLSKLAARASVNGDEAERIFTAHHLCDMIKEFKRQWNNIREAAESKAA
jgi:hypothetical protein